VPSPWLFTSSAQGLPSVFTYAGMRRL
jgi:hypothetical protein